MKHNQLINSGNIITTVSQKQYLNQIALLMFFTTFQIPRLNFRIVQFTWPDNCLTCWLALFVARIFPPVFELLQIDVFCFQVQQNCCCWPLPNIFFLMASFITWLHASNWNENKVDLKKKNRKDDVEKKWTMFFRINNQMIARGNQLLTIRQKNCRYFFLNHEL